MWRTRVGYAGGDRSDPTYHDLGDQTECFQVDFDPEKIAFADLVETALLAHNPTWVAHRPQYASLILAHDEAQLHVAIEVAARFSARIGGKRLATRIEPLKAFWLAEDYHQKYHLRQDRVLMADFRALLGDEDAALRESTAAARVNGYVAGDGSNAQLTREVDLLGLGDVGRSRLISLVKRAGDGIGCPVD